VNLLQRQLLVWRLKRFKANTSNYLRSHNPKSLGRMVGCIGYFENLISRHDANESSSKITFVNGWAEPSALAQIRTNLLEDLNPNVHFTLYSNIRRRDVSKHLSGKFRLKSLGFKIVFVNEIQRKFELFSEGSHIYPQTPLQHLDPNFAEKVKNLITNVNENASRKIVFIDGVTELDNLPLRNFENPKTLLFLLDVFSTYLQEFLITLRYVRSPLLAAWLAKLSEGDFCQKFTFLSGDPIDQSYVNWKLLRLDLRFFNAEKSRQECEIFLPDFNLVAPYLYSAKPGNYPIKIASRGTVSMNDVTFQSGGTIYSKESLYVLDRAADPRNEFVSGQWDHVFSAPIYGDHALVKPFESDSFEFDNGILLASRNDANWYHWLIETLPRAIELDQRHALEIPFILSSRVPTSGIEALRKITQRTIVQVDSSKSNKAQILHAAYPSATIRDSVLSNWKESITLDADAILSMKEKLIANIGVSKFPKKVFLVRESSHRGLVNQSEIIESAIEFGLHPINSSDLNFVDQVNLFYHAELLAGASGAIMANFIFLQPEARVLSLTSEMNSTGPLPALMCQLSGAQYFTLEGHDTNRATNLTDNLHNNFKINSKKFENSLRFLENYY
jgi:capsular polysaccharide biosynthesis protein